MKFRVALALVGAVLLSACGLNSVPTAEENAKAKFATYQSAIQRRADLLPNLAATVKGSADFEKSTQVAVAEARAKTGSAQLSPDQLTDPAKVQAFGAAQAAASAALTRIITEAPPELRSTENFGKLQDQIEGAENRIWVALGDYNKAVQEYNTRIRTFPDAVGAKIFYGAKPMVPFEARPGAENAPKIDFGNGS
ncbi:LemA family protein [Sphingomonas naasensis]|uniref:LemA family protein n=1 Tax=Sphingomonas naasensis TaxID=1344951 RepID=A0A4S1WF93_9SPHN|nr:LemA family protein [Sphingomonas naasensis]TGX41681.1 LemA family protein [Sphingomonas naasensis]